MKKTLITLFALAGLASADVVTMADHWTFDSNLTSTAGKSFTRQNSSVTYSDGAADLSITKSGGIYLNDSNGLGLTGGNWAVQLYFSLGATNTSGTAQVLMCLNNASGGTQVAISNVAQGQAYGLAVAPGFTSWSDSSITSSSPGVDTYMALTIVNYNNTLYLAHNDEWATFGIQSATRQDGLSLGDNKLDRLTIAFGQNGVNGLDTQTMKLYDLAVYTFDSNTVSLAEVKEALVPEPATATLSLLALAGLAARRRRR